MARYYCILLDADNTLLDFDATERKALAETLEHYGITPDAETVDAYSRINSGLWADLEKGLIRREKLGAERFTRLLRHLGAAGKGSEMNQYYLERLSSHPDVLPGALEVLNELAEVATLAVVSNGFYKVQSRRIQESGVAEYMEDVFISEKMGFDKPDRRCFDTALRQLGVENYANVLVVGDSLSSDIRGGVNAGLDTCWYNPEGKANKSDLVPTYEIRDLTELYRIVMEEEELSNVGIKNRKHSV